MTQTEQQQRVSSSRGLARRISATLLCTLGAALVFSSAPALAGTGVSHPFLFSLDSGGDFSNPTAAVKSMALDESGGKLYATFDINGFPPVKPRTAIEVFDSSTGDFLSELSSTGTPQGDTYGEFARVVGARGLAVDNSGGPSAGTLYFATCPTAFIGENGDPTRCQDEGVSHGTIYVFGSSGNYLHQLDGSDTPTGFFSDVPPAMAVDSNGNLYVATRDSSSTPFIDEFDSSGKFLARIADPDLTPLGKVVDSAGDIYGDHRPYITQLDSAGNLLGNFGSAHILGAFGSGLAVDGSSGNLYVRDFLPADIDHPRIEVFGPTTTVTTPDLSIDAPSEIGFYTAHFSGTVNPQGVATSYHFEYRGHATNDDWASTPSQDAGSGNSDLPAVTDITLAKPLLSSTAYDVRLVATNTDADSSTFSGVETFTTDTVPPPTIDPPSSVTATSVHLSGTVTPRGLPTGWSFTLSGQGTSGNAGSGTTDVVISADVTGLDPNTTYHVALSEDNGGGTSAEVIFTTDAVPPQASVIPAGCITASGACLGGYVNPGHSSTTYYFEYGTDTSYGSLVPLAKDGDAGSALGFGEVTQGITGLQPSTTYHYRLLAHNQAGDAASADQTFSTHPVDPRVEPVRGIELVNAPDKGDQNLADAGITPDGDHVLWNIAGGGPGTQTGAGEPQLATRTPAGWQSSVVVPPAASQVGDGELSYNLLGYSPNLSSFVFDVTDGLLVNPDHTKVRVDDHQNQVIMHTFPGSGPAQPVVRVSDNGQEVYANSLESLDPGHVPGTWNVYDLSRGTAEQPELVSRLPDGSVPTCGVADSLSGLLTSSSYVAGADAPRVFFSSQGDDCNGPLNIYVRNLDTETTTLISDPAAPQGQSTSDATAIYATQAALVPGDTNGDSDIYRWREGAGNECLTCVLPDAKVTGLTVSKDLSHIYFDSSNQLVPGKGIPGQSNVYVYHHGGVDYVAPGVSPHEDPDIRASGVSVDGNTAVFRGAGMTADDNGICHAMKGGFIGPCAQLYRYDDTTGNIECISCPPPEVALGGISAGAGLGAKGWWPSADGSTVAFVTSMALVPSDVNNADDLYEWRNGLLRLVTDGVTEFSTLDRSGCCGPATQVFGLSSDGADILFSIGVPLTGHEFDHLTNLYDARIGGGFPGVPAPAPCIEDSCQGPLQGAPAIGSPSSATFSGPGNQPTQPAKRHHRKKRHHHKPRHAKHATRAQR